MKICWNGFDDIYVDVLYCYIWLIIIWHKIRMLYLINLCFKLFYTSFYKLSNAIMDCFTKNEKVFSKVFHDVLRAWALTCLSQLFLYCSCLINLCVESSISLSLFIQWSHGMIYKVSLSFLTNIPWTSWKKRASVLKYFIPLLFSALLWKTHCAYHLYI